MNELSYKLGVKLSDVDIYVESEGTDGKIYRFHSSNFPKSTKHRIYYTTKFLLELAEVVE